MIIRQITVSSLNMSAQTRVPLQVHVSWGGVRVRRWVAFRVLYRAPKRRMTTGRIACDVGWPNGNTVNLHFGTLAHKVRDIMGLARTDQECEVDIFVDWNERVRVEDDGEEWTLKPNVATAVERLRWTRPLRTAKIRRI